MEKNTLKKIMSTEEPITYRGIEYDIFESKGELTEFKGQKYRGLDENSYYVSIDNVPYKIVKDYIEFKKLKSIKDSETSKTHISNCIYLNKIELSHNNKIDAIGHSIFLGDFYYHGITDVNREKEKRPLLDIDFNGVNFEKDCIITNHNFEKIPSAGITFRSCHFARKLKIRNAENDKFYKDSEKEYEKAQENKLKLEKLHITDCTAGNEAYLRIGFLAVDNFVLSNLRLPQNAELNIGDCHFKCFKLNNFRNVGKFKLFKINILKEEYDKQKSYNPRFQIDNTSIGQADFQSLNLTSFARVIIFDNILSGIDYTNVQWGEDIEVGQYGKVIAPEIWTDYALAKYLFDIYEIETTEIAKKQDSYRTLKNVTQKNNDHPQELFFYKQEMKYHQKIASGNKEYSLSNRATLFFNKWTNEFGLNFWLPIAWLLGLAFIFYCLLLFSIDESCNSKYWKNFFEFLNPTHKVEFIANGCWNGYTYAIDFLFRIIEGLLIYQTIQAFRKYSRKL